jgi:glycosyltransferase involved in cell wall biosynthesis
MSDQKSFLTHISELPLVSIVTPSYNQGKFIRETIESVLSQDYPNLEYWVIDGLSTDETVSVLKQYEGDSRFNWISEKDDGQTDAINKGWSLCHGAVLAWLNSDDTYLPNAISTQVRVLMENPDCGVGYGDGIFIDEDSKELYKCHGTPFSIEELLRITVPLQPTVFLRREVYLHNEPLNAEYKYSMDSEYWVRISQATKFLYNPVLISTYRLHQDSKTVGSYSGFYEEWLKIADSYYRERDLSESDMKHKSQVYSGIYCKMAAIEAKSGTLSNVAVYLFKALQLGGFRFRMIKSLVVIFDRTFSLNFTPKLIQAWTYTRSRISHKTLNRL